MFFYFKLTEPNKIPLAPKPQNHYFYLMTLAQRKIELISWITNLEDETLLNQIESFRKVSLEQLPKGIVELLQASDSESIEDCVEHTNSRNILNN